ncbi:MAG: hypothetical protein GC134_01020 [Proteobacteria bacterium]|nr:hypothetical protein [Pseudomonadota bacterium]
MKQSPIARLFLSCPKLAKLSHYEIISGEGDSITFNMLAGTGTRVVHGLTLTFHRHEHGVNMSVRNTAGFERRNASIDSVVRDLSGWLHLSMTESVCWTEPKLRNEVFDTFKQACKGSWVAPLQYLRQKELQNLERYGIPADLYLRVFFTLTLVSIGQRHYALPLEAEG